MRHEATKPLSTPEHGQLRADRRHPVAPARLSRRSQMALWVMRVLVLVFTVMVIYTFVHALAA